MQVLRGRNKLNDDSRNSNYHIDSFLTYYVTFPHPPHYAVLLDGPWGIGKTFMLDRFLKNHFKEAPRSFCYVSLFGLRSCDQIDEAMLRSCNPFVTSDTMQFVGRLGMAALKATTSLDIKTKMKDFLKRTPGLIYIFDDLERVEMKVSTALGYINSIVEHEGAKVIIVANQSEIKDPKYLRRREKTVGRIFEVQAETDTALSYFLTKVESTSAGDILRKNRAVIMALYTQGEVNNLRILQQTLWDFSRLCDELTSKHRMNDAAMAAMLKLYVAFSFELKKGRLTADQIANRRSLFMGFHRDSGDDENNPIKRARDRYESVELNDPTLSDAVLTDALARGLASPNELRKCLDASAYFSNAPEPSWKAVWQLFERDDKETLEAIKKLEAEFVDRSLTDLGALRHVFGIRLWLSKIGELTISQDDVVKQGKDYIDDLVARDALAPYNADQYEDSFTNTGHDGYGFMEAESSHFKELCLYLLGRRKEVMKTLYPAIAVSLIDEMKSDLPTFCRRLVSSNIQVGATYLREPVLSGIAPSKFVDELMALPSHAQRRVMSVFEDRHRGESLIRDLADERSWILDVRQEIIARLPSLSKISQFRWNDFIARDIDANLRATP